MPHVGYLMEWRRLSVDSFVGYTLAVIERQGKTLFIGVGLFAELPIQQDRSRECMTRVLYLNLLFGVRKFTQDFGFKGELSVRTVGSKIEALYT